MSKSHRLLGFGFAAADLLVEIGSDGRVSFALGAGEAVLGARDQTLIGQSWNTLIHPDDRGMVEAVFEGLADGTRAGPVVVGVAGPPGEPATRYASLTAIRLPLNDDAISCALSRSGARGASELQSREAFEARATELLSGS
ncbi:MAG TPA: PAS domain-containing protein, partial [Phenylobacterium sp.]|nr:PAS domain-containing protein [Phenylobacterium sp.]